MNTLFFVLVTLISPLGLVIDTAHLSQTMYDSVELNLAELSPLGESSGYAVPASGGSYGSVPINLACIGTNQVEVTVQEYEGPNRRDTDPFIVEGQYFYKSDSYPKTFSVSDVNSNPEINYTYTQESSYELESPNGTPSRHYSYTTVNDSYTNIDCGEVTECTDNTDNDNDGGIDWDGGANCGTVSVSFEGNQGPWEDVGGGGAQQPTFVSNVSEGDNVEMVSSSGTWSYRISGGTSSGDVSCSEGTLSFTDDSNNQISKVILSATTGGYAVPAGATKAWVSADDGYGNYFDNSGTRDNRTPCEVEISVGGDSCIADPECDGPSDESESGISVTLEACNLTEAADDINGCDWYDESIDIVTGDDAALKWDSSAGTESCVGYRIGAQGSAGDFTAASGNAPNGSTTDILEPSGNTAVVYGVQCVDADGNSSVDAVVINNTAYAAVSLLANPGYLHRGEETHLSWNLRANNPADCTLTGSDYLPGDAATRVADNPSGVDVAVYGETTFTLTCPDSSDSVTVRILPSLEET